MSSGISDYENYAFDVRISINSFSESEAELIIFAAVMERIDGHLLAAQRQARVLSVLPANDRAQQDWRDEDEL
jgi:hypothetical protein